MKTVQAYIAEKQRSFSLHPFFCRLQRNEALRHVLPFIPNLTFWVLAFQDVLRINESLVGDPQLRNIARHHRAEDSGHDKWFLNDLLKIQGANPDLRTLFGAHHAATRDCSYALISETYRASSDHERIILLLALESTGHVFFDTMASYFERMGISLSLQYLSRHHINVEKAHEVFEQQVDAFLASIILPEHVRAAATAMVDRVYAAFVTMFDSFESIIQREVDADACESTRPAADALLLANEAQLAREFQSVPSWRTV